MRVSCFSEKEQSSNPQRAKLKSSKSKVKLKSSISCLSNPMCSNISGVCRLQV